MKSPDTITAYTVPSTWVRADRFRTAEPYERLVGIIDSDGERIWSNYVAPGDALGEYNQTDAAELILPSTNELSTRLANFFKKYQQELNGPFANCHIFGRAMSGEHVEPAPQAQLMEQGELLEGSLKLGQVGILGYRGHGLALPLHTMVGLGEDREDCLQVMAAMSYLGVRSYEETQSYHLIEVMPAGMAQLPPPPGFGIYAQSPTAAVAA